MNYNKKDYVDELYRHLRQLPEEERIDAVREIASHIEDGLRNGQSEASLLAKLGDPQKLAKAYRSEHIMQRPNRSLRDILAMIGFYCTTGLVSIMIITVLATIAYGFGFCAVLIFLAVIIRTFGVSWIQMNVGPGLSVPYEWSLAFSAVFGGIVGGIAYFSRKYLRIYLKFLSEQYRSVLPAHK